jgi:hypothetical protein
MNSRALVAKVRLPRYLRAKKRADGSTGYFWELPSWARPPAERWAKPCPVSSEALGTDLAAAIGKADMLNTFLDEWRAGVDTRPAEGTIKALFGWYRSRDRYKELGALSKADYLKYMPIVEAYPLKSTLLGDRQAAEINADHVDAIYRALIKQRGKRAAAYCMQICRRVWNEGNRSEQWKRRLKGSNPFAKMGIKMVAEHGNRATSREEYDLFRAKAHEMGIHSMAVAAAIAFELVRRTTDVFGFIREKGDEEKGFFWEDYRPGVQFAMRQGKTGISQVIPLRGDPEAGEEDDEIRERGRLLYPSLEDELTRQGRGEGHIVLNEASGNRYTSDEMARVFRKIRVAAGLPDGMSFTGFRHGGATELGDVGIEDIRPISGHKTLAQTTVYNKVTEKKARRIGERRRAGVEGRK